MKPKNPLIMLMNTTLYDNQIKEMQAEGYNVKRGNFGLPYTENPDYPLQVLYENSYFPDNFSEADVVIIDLSYSVMKKPLSQRTIADQKGRYLLAGHPLRFADPRSIHMSRRRAELDTIYQNGGTFIIFIDENVAIDVYVPSHNPQLFAPQLLKTFRVWDFLTVLESRIEVIDKKGNSFQITSTSKDIQQLLQRHAEGVTFHAEIKTHVLKDRWHTLAINKFGSTIAAMLAPTPGTNEGYIFFFPHFKDKPAFLLDLFKAPPSELTSIFFSETKKADWLGQDIFNLPRVRELEATIQHIREETDRQIQELLGQVSFEKESHQFLFELMSESGTPLVNAVKQALKTIGFQEIIDRDEVLKARGVINMEEDLNIGDRLPLILVEIKGVEGRGTESQALQVTKHFTSRAEEMKLQDSDIHGITILNHEIETNPLDRITQPFTDLVIQNTKKTSLGLMTTWTLYKLVLNYIKHKWKHEQVADLFYRRGFIEPIPLHYEYIGRIDGFLPKYSCVTIQIEKRAIFKGDRVAFVPELLPEYEEQIADSMQLDGKLVEEVQVGKRFSLLTSLPKEKLRNGTRVYRVV
jgi:hypothetical protein